MTQKLKPIVLPKPSTNLNYSSIDPLDSRYFDPEIAMYLSEESRILYQAYIEAALAQTLADGGVISRKIANEIENATRKITAKKVYGAEKITKHDIKALVNTIKENVGGSAKPFVHFGATSYDIVATAQSLQMRDALCKVVIPRLIDLERTLIKLADQYSNTIQIGRTHGQHALPITFGFALSEYVSRLGQNILHVKSLANDLKGKFSGAVGAYNALSIFIEDPRSFEVELLKKVELEAAPYSSQILPADNMVRLLNELTISAGIMANIGHDMRHLQRTEIAEIREKFEEGQTGSSTMAHKRNPWNFENVVSFSKQVIAQNVNAQLNLTSEHQRDLTDSASSRFYTIIPASIAAMSKRLTKVLSNIEVDKAKMQANLDLQAIIIGAEPLYLLLEKYGHTAAHEKVNAMTNKAMRKQIGLSEIIGTELDLNKYWEKFTPQEKNIVRQPEKYYTGLAAKKTKSIVNYWNKKLATIN